MSKPVSKKSIGVFVVVAVALIVAAILILGSGKFFRSYPKYVMYFQGSVKGLSVGSPVMFRGVKIGTVTDISMDFDQKDLKIVIPVYVELGQGPMQSDTGIKARANFQGRYAQDLIKRGIRAQLEMQSFVTGQLMVSLDFRPETPAKLVGRDKRYTEIPTIPTNLEALTERLQKIPFQQMFDRLNASLDAVHNVISSPEVHRTLVNLSNASHDAGTLIRGANAQLEPLARNTSEALQEIRNLAQGAQDRLHPITLSITKTSDEAQTTLKGAQDTMASIDGLVGEDSALAYQLPKTLSQMEEAARSIRLFTDQLNREPETLLWGKKK